ncbi:MAG: SDR family oxidoreductase [Actinomycetota bacterium]|nr:SDR family oxidoreductase [Actinomycetota bacterium]
MTHQVVAITGASAGVGRATAMAFARRGASLALLARGKEGLQAARQEVIQAGSKAIDIPLDVSDAEAVERAADTVEQELGPIDVWVNNAMVSVFAPFKEISATDFARVNDVTYMGYVHGTMAALRRMAPRNHGCIIQVGSALAYRSIPLQSAYCGAKHAIKGFTESLRCELLHDKSDVRLTMVCLPALNTPQFHWVKTSLERHPQPVPPIFQPEVAAEAIVWASEHDRREVNVGLPTSLGILANRFIPGLLDRYLAKTGYDSQQTDFPIEPNRRDNLWQPVAGDHGAHGEFDDRAFSRSVQWWFTTRRRTIAAAASGLGFALWRLRK